jgi:purine nucleosidase
MIQMILDLDTGIDDSLALAYALANPDIKLLGVTGIYGNVTTSQGVQNALDMLHLFGEDAIPVFLGEDHAMDKEGFDRHEVVARIHGENGVGQITLPRAFRKPENCCAVDFLIESCRTWGKKLVLVATGPLTNLAKALEKEPEIANLIGKVIVMGGALTVRGNVSHFAEANIYKDPVAAKKIFESALDLTMVGLDVTQRSRLNKKDTQAWRDLKTKSGRLFADMTDYYIANTLQTDETYIHDPSAVICAMHPEFFTALPFFLTVETEGVEAGRIIVDHTKLRSSNPTTKVCLNVDSPSVERELCNKLKDLFTKN